MLVLKIGSCGTKEFAAVMKSGSKSLRKWYSARKYYLNIGTVNEEQEKSVLDIRFSIKPVIEFA